MKFNKLIIILLVSTSSVTFALDSNCSLPNNLMINEEHLFSSGCTLAKLNLAKQQFSLVENITKKTDITQDRIFVGIAEKGLIFQVNSEEEVLLVMKTEKWKTKKPLKLIKNLLKDSFQPVKNKAITK